MSKISLTEQYKVYLEKNDGTVLAAPVRVEYISMSSDFDGTHKTEIGLVADGPVNWMLGKEFTAKEVEQTKEEWLCTWCGRPNGRADEVCKSCGGSRSFLYGIGRK